MASLAAAIVPGGLSRATKCSAGARSAGAPRPALARSALAHPPASSLPATRPAWLQWPPCARSAQNADLGRLGRDGLGRHEVDLRGEQASVGCERHAAHARGENAGHIRPAGTQQRHRPHMQGSRHAAIMQDGGRRTLAWPGRRKRDERGSKLPPGRRRVDSSARGTRRAEQVRHARSRQTKGPEMTRSGRQAWRGGSTGRSACT